MGTVFALRAASAADEASRLRQRVRAPADCQAALAADCAALESSVERENTSRSIANVAFAAGAIIGAGTLATWLVWPSSSSRATVRIAPALAPRLPALSVAGRF
jgi:hypothetical protein